MLLHSEVVSSRTDESSAEAFFHPIKACCSANRYVEYLQSITSEASMCRAIRSSSFMKTAALTLKCRPLRIPNSLRYCNCLARDLEPDITLNVHHCLI